jgi:hypothetical protein
MQIILVKTMFNRQLFPRFCQLCFTTPGLLKIKCGFTTHCSLPMTTLKPQSNSHLGLGGRATEGKKKEHSDQLTVKYNSFQNQLNLHSLATSFPENKSKTR